MKRLPASSQHNEPLSALFILQIQPMWKELFSFIQTVITLSKEQNQIRADLKEMQNQFTHLILKVQTLNDQIVINQERQTAAITLLKKELEIEILKIRQELNLRPPTTPSQLLPDHTE
jgi:cob(I)alamin adenosyltransferase